MIKFKKNICKYNKNNKYKYLQKINNNTTGRW